MDSSLKEMMITNLLSFSNFHDTMRWGNCYFDNNGVTKCYKKKERRKKKHISEVTREDYQQLSDKLFLDTYNFLLYRSYIQM